MTHVTCRLTDKNRDQLRNPTLGSRVWAAFTLLDGVMCTQNVPKLCQVMVSCVAAFAVDFWLQTNLFQSGVLWHLLLFLFDYDFTLEEGGVEKSDESNQQVFLSLPL